MSVVQIAIKALDEYSGVLTGFNQGLEIVGKGFSVLKGAAEAAMSGIQKSVEVAAQGGSYVEMRRQFNAVAESYGQDGQRIVESIKAISQNSTSMSDNVRLASKAVTTGLSGEQIEAAFTFVKRRTESTGEDFAAMSERVFQALQSGRTSVLKQMGLVVEKGDDVATVVAKMTAETKKYGDTGFNVGDSLQSMAQSQNALTTAIGAGINESEVFQKAIKFVEETMRELADAFDPRYLTAFIDIMGEVGYSLLQMIPGFDSAAGAIEGVFGSAQISVKDMAKSAIDWIGILLSTVSETKNDIARMLLNSEIIDIMHFVVKSVVDIVAWGQKLIVNAVAGSVEYATRALVKLVQMGEKVQDAVTGKTAARYLGLIDEAEVSEDVRMLSDFADAALQMRNSVTEGYEGTANAVNGLIESVADGSKRFVQDSIASFDADAFTAGMKAKIDAIDTDKHWAEALGTGKPAIDAALSDLADTTQKGLESKVKPVIESTAKAVRESVQKAIPSASDLAAPAQRAAQAIREPIQQAVQAIQGSIEQATQSRAVLEPWMKEILSKSKQGTWIETSPQGVVTLNLAHSRLIDGQYVSAGKLYYDESGERLKEADALRILAEGRSNLAQQDQQRTAEQQRQEQQRQQQASPAAQLQQMYANVNWPQEMDAFMRVIFSWLVKIANIEEVPIAVSTRSL